MLILTQNILITLLLSFGVVGYGSAAKKSSTVHRKASVARTAVQSGAVAGKAMRANSLSELKTNLEHRIRGIDPKALDAGLKAYLCANSVGHKAAKKYLTIIDYNKPSSQERMYIIDMQKQQLVSSQLVAHGQNTGGRDAFKFSNKDGSHQSSLGVFLTGNVYQGKNGLSLRLQGLEQGYNDKASRRAIVMHGANSVSRSYVKRFGQIGRSWGCPAIDAKSANSTINKLKTGSVVVAYYNDKNWLNQSNYLHCKAVA